MCAALAALGLAIAPAGADARGVRAGAAAVDASWHVGASAGQYASDGSFVSTDQGVDPTMHSTRRASSYGIQSRLSARALVTEGSNGKRVALVKYDMYIPEDLLYRRVAQILEADGKSGITRANLTLAVTHDHSSPMYSSASWGVWAFQDVIDVRFFNYYAERIATAVERAAARMRPVRVGARVIQFDKTHRHSFGPAIADDGTPAGYPNSDADHAMTIVRYDDVSRPGHPRPLATLVNYSLHGEMLEGNDLIAADWFGALQRMLDRRTHAVTVITQNAVGTGEPERSSYHSIHERLEFTHTDYAQAEFAARLMADAALGAWRSIPRLRSVIRGRAIPMRTSFPVEMQDRWYPGPISHPYPGVSNCRTDKVFTTDPQVPVVGLPDCKGPSGGIADLTGQSPPDVPAPQTPGLTTDDFERAGIPVPENYSAPAYTGLEQNLGIHLQAIRFGGMLFTICSCEQWKDQAFNIKTRTDRRAGDEYLGYDWKQQCDRTGATWSCVDPEDPKKRLTGLSDHSVERMHAQVTNPANGWNDPSYATKAESEPVDVRQIRGNYTHDDDARSAALGYDLTVPISMANDYNGYIATYREYSDRDHYRKALTGWGPHSSDYMASRLVWMGRHFHDPRYPVTDASDRLLATKNEADLKFQDAKARALGTVGAAATRAYDAQLPADGGRVEAAEQPRDIERFQAAFFSWNGGDNYTDNPVVRVQRLVRGRWRAYEDQTGEIPVRVTYPQVGELPAYLSGGQHWKWTASFEAFVAPFDTGTGFRATPPGRYRFVVAGKRRSGSPAAPHAYRVVSRTFRVRPWDGIRVEDLRVGDGGRVSLRVGPDHHYRVPDTNVWSRIGPIDYPDSYRSPFRFVRWQRTPIVDPDHPSDGRKVEWFCFTCSFRPWLDAGDAKRVSVVVGGRRVGAVRRGERWYATRRLRAGESAYVPAGGVRDAWGNVNGAASAPVTR